MWMTWNIESFLELKKKQNFKTNKYITDRLDWPLEIIHISKFQGWNWQDDFFEKTWWITRYPLGGRTNFSLFLTWVFLSYQGAGFCLIVFLYRDDHVSFVFYSTNIVCYIGWFSNVKPTLNPHLVTVIILFINCWIWFARTLLQISASTFIWNIGF